MTTIKKINDWHWNVGKTCLIQRFVFNTFTGYYQAVTFDVHTKDLVYDDKNYRLEIFDMGGHEGMKAARHQSLKEKDVIILCVSTNDVDTITTINDKWIGEL